MWIDCSPPARYLDGHDEIRTFSRIMTYSAIEVGSGTGKPSSSNPSKCISIASYMLDSASS